jgi:hypothetical protein
MHAVKMHVYQHVLQKHKTTLFKLLIEGRSGNIGFRTNVIFISISQQYICPKETQNEVSLISQNEYNFIVYKYYLMPANKISQIL